MHNFIPFSIGRWSISLLLSLLIFLISFSAISTEKIFLAIVVSIIGALFIDGDIVSRVARIIIPLWAIAAASWSGKTLGAFFAVLFFFSFQAISANRFHNLGWSAATFFVFSNLFLGFSEFWKWQAILMLLSSFSFFFIIAGHINSFSTRSQDNLISILIFLLIIMELIFVLRFLPFGYLSLSSIATLWYFTLLSLYEMQQKNLLSKKIILQEVLFSAFLTIIIAISSGIGPR